MRFDCTTTLRGRWIPRRCTLIALLSFGLSACASDPSGPTVGQLSGAEIYHRLCASCHGFTGHGDGPVASILELKVVDLTHLARIEGGEFPTEKVRRAIDGRWDREAHGPADMPVWGMRFYDRTQENDTAERARVDAMIGRLVDYLQSIQVK